MFLWKDSPLTNPVSGTTPAPQERRGPSFHQELLKTLPDLRGFARFLTRDATAADDLVQDTVVRALAAQTQFETGTTLKAWLFTIQRNAFYEQRRRFSREQEIMQDFELDMPVSSEAPSMQSARDAITDLGEILWKLPDLLREAIILVGAQELSYEDAACICNVPAGTMKARVSRARSQLAALTATDSSLEN